MLARLRLIRNTAKLGDWSFVGRGKEVNTASGLSAIVAWWWCRFSNRFKCGGPHTASVDISAVVVWLGFSGYSLSAQFSR
jgi:hypothetical protein